MVLLSLRHAAGAIRPGAGIAGKLSRKKTLVAWSLMLPALASVLLWQYVPLVRGAWMAFLDYRLPTMEDVPEIIPIIVEKENAKSPEDIRGVGEPPAIPTAAAIANAVYDAAGIRMHHLPMTPERVYRELSTKK